MNIARTRFQPRAEPAAASIAVTELVLRTFRTRLIAVPLRLSLLLFVLFSAAALLVLHRNLSATHSPQRSVPVLCLKRKRQLPKKFSEFLYLGRETAVYTVAPPKERKEPRSLRASFFKLFYREQTHPENRRGQVNVNPIVAGRCKILTTQPRGLLLKQSASNYFILN